MKLDLFRGLLLLLGLLVYTNAQCPAQQKRKEAELLKRTISKNLGPLLSSSPVVWISKHPKTVVIGSVALYYTSNLAKKSFLARAEENGVVIWENPHLCLLVPPKQSVRDFLEARASADTPLSNPFLGATMGPEGRKQAKRRLKKSNTKTVLELPSMRKRTVVLGQGQEVYQAACQALESLAVMEGDEEESGFGLVHGYDIEPEDEEDMSDEDEEAETGEGGDGQQQQQQQHKARWRKAYPPLALVHQRKKLGGVGPALWVVDPLRVVYLSEDRRGQSLGLGTVEGSSWQGEMRLSVSTRQGAGKRPSQKNGKRGRGRGEDEVVFEACICTDSAGLAQSGVLEAACSSMERQVDTRLKVTRARQRMLERYTDKSQQALHERRARKIRMALDPLQGTKRKWKNKSGRNPLAEKGELGRWTPSGDMVNERRNPGGYFGRS